jgi:hypothetical protein
MKYALRACEIFALRANVKEKIGQSHGFDLFCFYKSLFALQKATFIFCEAKYIIHHTRSVYHICPKGKCIIVKKPWLAPRLFYSFSFLYFIAACR